MHDIGDDVVIETRTTDIDGNMVNPGTVVVTVTDPAGTDTTPTVTTPTTGVHRAVVPADQAGIWSAKWETTGPAAVDYSYFEVSADPPTRKGPLASIADLEFVLGRALTDAERAKAPGRLHSASTRLRAWCRQDISRVDDDAVILRPVNGIIKLRQRPVRAVASVHTIGHDGQPDEEVPFSWDGADEITIRELSPLTRAYRVIYSHGLDVVSDIVVEVVAGAARRSISAPDDEPEGATQVTVGQFSQQHQQATGSRGTSVWFSKAELADVASAGWGPPRAATIRTKLL